MTGAPAGEDPLVRVQLTHALHLWQRRRGHRTGSDDVLCAWAGLSLRPAARHVLDLGAGHGAVTLMLAGALPEATLVAVERQSVSYDLLARNVRENGLADRVLPRLGDLRTLAGDGPPFDLVTGTPPFMPPGTGLPPADAQRAAARFELHGGIEEYCVAAARHLAEDGAVSLVMDAARPERYEAAVSAAGLHLVRVLRVAPRPGAAPTWIVYQAVRTPGEAAPASERLALRDADGEWTAEWAAARRAVTGR